MPNTRQPSEPNAVTPFVNNDTRVLVYFSEHPKDTSRQAGDALGLSDRTVNRIAAEHAKAGRIKFTRIGRGGIRKVVVPAKLMNAVRELAK